MGRTTQILLCEDAIEVDANGFETLDSFYPGPGKPRPFVKPGSPRYDYILEHKTLVGYSRYMYETDDSEDERAHAHAHSNDDAAEPVHVPEEDGGGEWADGLGGQWMHGLDGGGGDWDDGLGDLGGDWEAALGDGGGGGDWEAALGGGGDWEAALGGGGGDDWDDLLAPQPLPPVQPQRRSPRRVDVVKANKKLCVVQGCDCLRAKHRNYCAKHRYAGADKNCAMCGKPFRAIGSKCGTCKSKVTRDNKKKAQKKAPAQARKKTARGDD